MKYVIVVLSLFFFSSIIILVQKVIFDIVMKIKGMKVYEGFFKYYWDEV